MRSTIQNSIIRHLMRFVSQAYGHPTQLDAARSIEQAKYIIDCAQRTRVARHDLAWTPASEESIARCQKIVDGICEKRGIPVPRVVAGKECHGFTFSHPRMEITLPGEPDLQRLTEGELFAVLAHEVGHSTQVPPRFWLAVAYMSATLVALVIQNMPLFFLFAAATAIHMLIETEGRYLANENLADKFSIDSGASVTDLWRSYIKGIANIRCGCFENARTDNFGLVRQIAVSKIFVFENLEQGADCGL